jgi:hypothetical protein
MLSSARSTVVVCLLLSAYVVSAPAKATHHPSDAVLIQVVNGKTRHMSIGGSFLPSSTVLSKTATASKPLATGPAGLVAAEVTEVATKTGNGGTSILVQYYQEKNSKAAFTSYASRPSDPPRTNQTGITAPPEDPVARQWVDLHNRARAPFGAGKLRWREDLVAKAKANAILCTGDHS